MTEKTNCDDTSEIVCPYCGHEHQDSYELVDEEYPHAQSVQCGNCEKKFMAESFTVTKYNTNKAECLNGAADHNWDDWYRPLARGLQYRRCKMCNQKESREVK